LRIHLKSSVFAITSASSIKLPAWKTLESLLVEKYPAASDRGIQRKKFIEKKYRSFLAQYAKTQNHEVYLHINSNFIFSIEDKPLHSIVVVNLSLDDEPMLQIMTAWD